MINKCLLDCMMEVVISNEKEKSVRDCEETENNVNEEDKEDTVKKFFDIVLGKCTWSK